jgi:YVTN family beta-propeller protein
MDSDKSLIRGGRLARRAWPAWVLPLVAGVLVMVALGTWLLLRSRGSAEAGLAGYRVVADVPLNGGTSRFDYLSLDASGHRLYVAHLGASTITVFDTQGNKVVQDLPGVAGVHGVVAIPELHRIYASATNDNKVAVIDADSYKVVATVPTGDYPDGLAYDPDDHKLFVSNEHGGTDTVIDVNSNQRVADIQVGSDVGNTQYDSQSHRIFVAVGGPNQLVEIDPAANKVVAQHPLPGCDGAHGVYLNSTVRVAYVACESNAKLLAIDMASWQVTSADLVGATPDVLAFDSSLRRLYVASESGIVSVFQADGKGLRQLAEGNGGPNAHAVAVDPASHNVYLPLANLNGKPAMRILAPASA